MKTYIAILIAAVMLTGCHRQKRATVTTNRHITIVELQPAGFQLTEYEREDRTGHYPVYYIGPVKDTIELDMPLSPREEDGKNYDTVLLTRFVTNISSIVVFVDTSISTAHCVYHYYTDGNNLQKPVGAHMLLAYPVYIYNLTDSFAKVGDYNILTNTVRQAKNVKGEWQDIENPTDFFCGYGARQIIAEPHQMIVAKLLRYKGDYFTECRLKCGRRGRYLYSNSFYDYIDKRQLTDTLDPYW